MIKPEIITIKLGGMSANCYLIKIASEFILIDTGSRKHKNKLVKALNENGCKTGNLKFIFLTHGDFDHTGNALFLKNLYDAKIVMQKEDAVVVETGNMFINRKQKHKIISVLIKIIMGIKKFKPDVLVNNNDIITINGIEIHILHLPGHSPGSIGILAGKKQLFCGDLIENTKYPKFNSIMDNIKQGKASLDKLKTLSMPVQVFPGHGDSFELSEYINNL